MAAPLRSRLVQFGPGNGTAWTEALPGGIQLNHTDGEYIVCVVPQISPQTIGGSIVDGLPSASGVIQNLSQVFLTYDNTVSANLAGYILTCNLYRAGSLIGGGGFAGWAISTAPAYAQWTTKAVPFLTANTALVPSGGQTAVTTTNALLPLQAWDVITVATTNNSQTANGFIRLDIL